MRKQIDFGTLQEFVLNSANGIGKPKLITRENINRLKKIKKDHFDHSLNRMDNYFFNHHIFLLVELSYLRGNQSFYFDLFIKKTDSLKVPFLNPIKHGSFRGCSRMEREKIPSLPKICQTYPTIIKLGRAIPYLKKNQIYINHVTQPLSSADISFFFTRNQKFLLYKELQIQILF